jgi:hypothetical protein
MKESFLQRLERVMRESQGDGSHAIDLLDVYLKGREGRSLS